MIGNFRLPASFNSSSSSNEWTEQLWQDAYDLYQRPADWLDITTAYNLSGLQKFVGLHAIFENEGNFISLLATTSTGQYLVDWGDGTTSLHNSGTVAYKNITYASINISTLSILGYKQAIIVVTPVSGNLLTFDICRKHNQSGLANGYSTGWLDIRMAGASFTSLVMKSSTSLVTQSMLEQFEFVGANLITNGTDMFLDDVKLQKIVSLYTNSLTNGTSMFFGCIMMKTYPLLNLSAMTTGNNMFYNNYSVLTYPFFVLSLVTNGLSMFFNNYSVTAYPQFNLSSLIQGVTMFFNNYSVIKYPLFSLGSLTTGNNMFENNYSVIEYPLFDLHSLTTGTRMFYNNYSVTTYPLFNLSAMTAGNQMFFNNYSVTTYPLFNLGVMTNGIQMFYNNVSVIEHPLYNLGAMTQSELMFANNYSVKKHPLYDLANLTYAYGMFQNNYSVIEFPLFDLSKVDNAPLMFDGCKSLIKLPAFNLTLLLITANAAGFNTNCNSLSKFEAINIKSTVNFTNCKLSAPELVVIFNNLYTIAGKTITISGNWGALILTAPERAIATAKGWTIVG